MIFQALSMTVEFVIRKFKKNGDLMLLFLFRESKNFRVHEMGNIKYYTWCPREEDLKMGNRIYNAVSLSNSVSRKKPEERHEAVKGGLDLKPFYT